MRLPDRTFADNLRLIWIYSRPLRAFPAGFPLVTRMRSPGLHFEMLKVWECATLGSPLSVIKKFSRLLSTLHLDKMAASFSFLPGNGCYTWKYGNKKMFTWLNNYSVMRLYIRLFMRIKVERTRIKECSEYNGTCSAKYAAMELSRDFIFRKFYCTFFMKQIFQSLMKQS